MQECKAFKHYNILAFSHSSILALKHCNIQALNHYSMTPAKEKPLSVAIVVFSAIVVFLVAAMFQVAPPENLTLPFDPKILPKFHAGINFTVSILLMLSFYFIKQKKINAHRICNISALVLSAMFLVSYVTYHTVSESTKFGGEGVIKYVYYFILLTHIALAAIILPIILFTFMRAFLGQYDKHRKIARWTFPLWLYVSITGVLVYLMISPYY